MSSRSGRKPTRRQPGQRLTDAERARELRRLDARVVKQVRKLRAMLAEGPRPGEGRQEFVDRLYDRFELGQHRAYRRFLEIVAGKRRSASGRPPDPRFLEEPKLPKQRGRPETFRFTREEERQLVHEIDGIKEKEKARNQVRVTDGRALLIWLITQFARDFIRKGHSRTEANCLAKIKLQEFQGRPNFSNALKRQREHLSRIRRELKLAR